MADAALAALHPRAYASRFLARGVRPDGRGTHACRRLTLALGTLGSADGSATVRLGAGTSVVAAVTVELRQLAGAAAAALEAPGGAGAGEPALSVELSLLPMASPRFRARGGGPAAQLALKRGPQIAREIERLVAACRLLDPQQLLLEEGVCGLRLVVDVLATAADGNVEDAALLAAVAALSATTIPSALKRADGSGWSLQRGGDAVRPAPAAGAAAAAGAAGNAAHAVGAHGASRAARPPARLAVACALVPTSCALLQLVDGAAAAAAVAAVGADEGAAGSSSDGGSGASSAPVGDDEASGGGAASRAAPRRVLVADPDDGEEALASASVRVVVAVPLAQAGGASVGVAPPGGSDDTAMDAGGGAAAPLAVAGVSMSGAALPQDELGACVALAQARARAVADVLRRALAALDSPATATAL